MSSFYKDDRNTIRCKKDWGWVLAPNEATHERNQLVLEEISAGNLTEVFIDHPVYSHGKRSGNGIWDWQGFSVGEDGVSYRLTTYTTGEPPSDEDWSCAQVEAE